MNTSKEPFTLQSAIIFIVLAMVLEIIGISINAVRSTYGEHSILLAHTLMIVTGFSTFVYLVKIEKRSVKSRVGIFISVLSNMLFLFVVVRSTHSNPILLSALVFDSIGAIFLLCPASIDWINKIQSKRTI